MTTTRLVLVRHGQTAANVKRLLHGLTDLPLDETGERQAKMVAARIRADFPADALLSSPLARAWATARAVSLTTGLPIQERHELKEMHFGNLEGYSIEQLQIDHPEIAAQSLDPHNLTLQWPEGDHIDDFYQRSATAFDVIAQEFAGQSVIVVAHGGVIGAYLRSLKGIATERLASASVDELLYFRCRCRGSAATGDRGAKRLSSFGRIFNAADRDGVGMILDVLGSAAAGGNAGSGCAGYLVRSGGTRVLIDCGPGSVPELKGRIDVRDLDAIVISHMHVDHFLDLVTLRAAYRYAPEPFEGRIPLWLPPGGPEILDSLAAPIDIEHHSPLFFEQVYRTSEYNPIDSLLIGEISFDFAPTQHSMPGWAMRVAAVGTNRALGYTSDTGPVTHLAQFLQGVDVLICEATFLESEVSPIDRGHLTAQEAGRLAQTCQAKRLLLTHTWEEFGSGNLVAGAAASYSGPIEIAWPGMEIEIS